MYGWGGVLCVLMVGVVLHKIHSQPGAPCEFNKPSTHLQERELLGEWRPYNIQLLGTIWNLTFLVRVSVHVSGPFRVYGGKRVRACFRVRVRACEREGLVA